METSTQPLACQLKHKKKSSLKKTSPLHWINQRRSDEFSSTQLLLSSSNRGDNTQTTTSKNYQFLHRSSNNSNKIKPPMHLKGQQSNSISSKNVIELKKIKRRSNEDSLFSFLSISSKNNEENKAERKYIENNEELSSPVYSQTSFLSSSSTIDIPSQVQSEKIKNSSSVITPVHISIPRSQNSITSPFRMSASSSICKNKREDSPKCTSSHPISNKCQKNFETDDHKEMHLPLELSIRHKDFFQEQQEQEYRIAKAWLEAEESRKSNSSILGGPMISGSTECHWDDTRVKLNSLENRRLENSTISKNIYDNRTISCCRLKQKVVSKLDNHAPFDGAVPTEYSMTDKIVSEKEENNVKRKRMSDVANLAIGVRGWLSRRVRSN
ncbi:hypothetical protein EV44_g2454 [Erysiphe necator]|uniref:Uncharacterized protein n=1 Tax=Uncinula necator TaxID=52586 RepID=A0A0B1NVI7_UNCNE|nr:hypothetical protein EV44_g2454 [Erysiphe necator]